MNNDEAKIWAAQMDKTLPELDLHGFYPDEAMEQVELFLYNNYQLKEKVIRLIYGGGTGKLKQTVLDCLQDHPLIDKIVDEGASAIVLIA